MHTRLYVYVPFDCYRSSLTHESKARAARCFLLLNLLCGACAACAALCLLAVDQLRHGLQMLIGDLVALEVRHKLIVVNLAVPGGVHSLKDGLYGSSVQTVTNHLFQVINRDTA